MAEEGIKWTEQQLRAIVARGSDVLVTASAGTGKTAVLSGRCVDIVSDKSICPDIWGILVLTFTDMAAEQMRQRIAQQLESAFWQTGDSHLYRQLILLPGADIGTIHSFCKRLITEYFYELHLDPTFRVMDADEARLLKAETLDKTIDWAWRQSHLQAALRQLLRRRDLRTNGGFLGRIIELNDFLDGVISRRDWCNRAILLSEAINPFTSDLGQKQKQIMAHRLRRILNQLQYILTLYTGEAADVDWADKLQDSHIKPVEQCLELLQAGHWDRCVEAIRSFRKPATGKPRDLPAHFSELIHRMAKDAMDSFKGLSQLAVCNPDYLDKLAGSVSQQTRVLIELVRKFDRLYSQAKRSANCLDFADLEHQALKLLAKDIDTADELLPSETALALRRKYQYIFVDEYQDINPVQKAILRMLSSEGNVFVVGDVKQSIYAWRGAEPNIFIEDLKLASPDPDNALKGLRVDLNANFRSARAILEFVNKVFSRIMTTSFGDIDYDDRARLKPAVFDESKVKAPSGPNIVELHILDETGKDRDWQIAQGVESTEGDLNMVTARRRQAAMIARRIGEMVGATSGKAEFQIYDKQRGCRRDVEYRDIVILMRSLAKRANDYVEILRLAGVPVSCQATAGYFETTEITDMLSLLKVLDNPRRDIELAAVLRSPFFKISDTELAKIKMHSEHGDSESRDAGAASHKPGVTEASFYDGVVQYCKTGSDRGLAGKLEKNLAQIEAWRTLARRGKLAELIWQIYRQSGFLSFVSALPNGQARRANLLKLHDRAIQFEGFAAGAGVASLTRLVEFIERLQETGQDWSPAEPPGSAPNAVRILSVHKSKGLEFPVVFLAELQGRFNKKDIRADCLADAAHTLGLQIIDHSSNSKLCSLAHQVIAEEKLSALLAEEMRILYVATTRARDRLILTASQKQANCRQIITKGLFFGAGPIPGWELRNCDSPVEWILYGLSDQKDLHVALGTGLEDRAEEDNLFRLRVYGRAELEQLSRFVRQLRSDKLVHSVWGGSDSERRRGQRKGLPKQVTSRLLSRVKKSLSWRYPFGYAPVLPAKQSVSELTHRDDEYIRFDYSGSLGRQPVAVLGLEAGVNEPQAGLIGTATHVVISRLDLSRPVTAESVGKTIDKLLGDGSVTEAVAEHIDRESILSFFESDLGRIALDSKDRVYREWAFTFALPASAVKDCYLLRDRRYEIPETIVVQGIIDMLIQSPWGLVVIDFKTDDITAEQVRQRGELYRQQIELYARAASAILNQKLFGKWLYFLTPGCAIEIK